MESVDVSIIIRAYNASNYILRSLYSVANTDYKGSIETIICYDKGSKDDTMIKIREFESSLIGKHEKFLMRVIEHEHTAPFRALLECGFKYSSGRFISILDADNLYPKKRISALINTWKKTGASFIFTPIVVFEDKTLKILKKIEAPKNPCSQFNLLKGNNIDASAMFIHRQCLDKIVSKLSKLDSRVYDWVFEDWLLAILATKYCKCFYTDNTYSLYRVHQSNLTGFKSDIPSKNVFNTIRDILTLMAFYEIEREALDMKEFILLYSTLLNRIIRLGFWTSKHFNIL
ncbi:MAG: glycosyltransferase family 2 protein [Nitrososphaerota archaeon]